MKRTVRQALDKARDAALLAVEVYNKPAVEFKSAAYVTLMVIAWTALFHAIFFKLKIRPYYRKPKSPGRFERAEGAYKHWELGECLSQYFKSDSGSPIRKNPEFDALAKQVGLKSHKDGVTDPIQRAQLRAQLDALIAHLYGLTEQEFAHILTTFPLVPQETKDAALAEFRKM